MDDLGRVLEAMNGAPRGFDVLLGEVVTWSDPEVVRAAMDRPNRRGAISMTLVARSDGAVTPERPITRIWFARDGRFRAENPWGTTVFDGQMLWTEHTSVVMRRAPEQDPLGSSGCANLLRPAALMMCAPFTMVGRERVAGHDALTVECRLSEDLWPNVAVLGLMGADRVRLAVDPATGVVLRLTSWFEARKASETGFEALEYDAPLAHDPFRYEPGPDAVVQTEADIRRQMLEQFEIDTTDIDLDDEAAVSEAMRDRVGRPLVFGGPGPVPPPPRPDLAARHMPLGTPDDVDAARAAVTDAIVHMTEIDDDGGLPNVQGGSNLGEVVVQASTRAGVAEGERAAFVVDDVVFVRTDEAVAAFRVIAPIVPYGFPQTGRVLLIDGRWVVERATMCSLLAMGGATCPPPPSPNDG